MSLSVVQEREALVLSGGIGRMSCDHGPPLSFGRVGVLLDEGRADKGGHDTPALASCMGQRIAHEVDSAALPRSMQHLGSGGTWYEGVRIVDARADELVVPAESSKLSVSAGYLLCSLEKVSFMVTDEHIRDRDAQTIERGGIKLITVTVPSPQPAALALAAE